MEIASLGARPAETIGTLRIERLVGAGKGAALSALRVTLKPGARHPPLWHARTAEFFVVLKGSQTARIDGERRRFARGDCAYLPPGTLHEFRAGRDGVEVLAIFTPPLDSKKPDIVMKD